MTDTSKAPAQIWAFPNPPANFWEPNGSQVAKTRQRIVGDGTPYIRRDIAQQLAEALREEVMSRPLSEGINMEVSALLREFDSLEGGE